MGMASSESGSLHKPPPQLRRENQSHSSRGPNCTQNPQRGRSASTPRYPGSRSSESSARRYHVRSRGDAPLRRSLQREVRSRAREHPRPQAGPSARGRLSPLMNGRCRLQEERGRGTGTLGRAAQGPRWEGRAGSRRGAEPQRVAPAPPPRKGGLYRSAADLQPLPAPPRPAGPAPRPPFLLPAPSPPSLPAGCNRLSGETNAKRRGDPSTKMSCDILLMAIIYSKSSLD